MSCPAKSRPRRWGTTEIMKTMLAAAGTLSIEVQPPPKGGPGHCRMEMASNLEKRCAPPIWRPDFCALTNRPRSRLLRHLCGGKILRVLPSRFGDVAERLKALVC